MPQQLTDILPPCKGQKMRGLDNFWRMIYNPWKALKGTKLLQQGISLEIEYDLA
jgi:hypothetical protein